MGKRAIDFSYWKNQFWHKKTEFSAVSTIFLKDDTAKQALPPCGNYLHFALVTWCQTHKKFHKKGPHIFLGGRCLWSHWSHSSKHLCMKSHRVSHFHIIFLFYGYYGYISFFLFFLFTNSSSIGFLQLWHYFSFHRMSLMTEDK